MLPRIVTIKRKLIAYGILGKIGKCFLVELCKMNLQDFRIGDKKCKKSQENEHVTKKVINTQNHRVPGNCSHFPKVLNLEAL